MKIKMKKQMAFSLLLMGLGCVDGFGQASKELYTEPQYEWWRKSMEGSSERVKPFVDAKLGMFVIWGPYSTLGGMYKGEPFMGYSE